MKRILLFLLLLLTAAPLLAHCDWIKGPVVLDAKAALENADVKAAAPTSARTRTSCITLWRCIAP